jgi:hypothetical protein
LDIVSLLETFPSRFFRNLKESEMQDDVDPVIAKAVEWLELLWTHSGLTDARLDELEQGYASAALELDGSTTSRLLTAQFALAGVQAMKAWRIKGGVK